MSNYKKLALKALQNRKKDVINESVLYSEDITERMHPDLEKRFKEGRHSLSGTNIFPEGDLLSYDQKLIRERFKDVVMRCREAFDCNEVDAKEMLEANKSYLMEAMKLEGPHKKELEELAVEMVIEEFDIPEGTVMFEAELIHDIESSSQFVKENNMEPQETDIEFDSHDEIMNANKEVLKRRVLNAMTQGAAKNVNHMFHMKHDDLAKMNPRLPNCYKKLMSAVDYLYFAQPDLNIAVSGGICETDYSDEDDISKPVIKAKALTFPVLVHELFKGVMEVLSMHGLPTNENVAKYVTDKADYVKAEMDDMRFGPKIWERFCQSVADDDYHLKHHAYADLAAMPYDEFASTLKEIIAKTKLGKQRIGEMISETKRQIQEDDYNEAMSSRDDLFDIDDLL